MSNNALREQKEIWNIPWQYCEGHWALGPEVYIWLEIKWIHYLNSNMTIINTHSKINMAYKNWFLSDQCVPYNITEFIHYF